jgi:hypothetical protein
MIHKDLTLKYLYSDETDLIFEGYWKSEWFQAVFASGEYEFGWHNMTFRGQFSKEDQGVLNLENDEYDDIIEALEDVDVIYKMIVDIK